MCLVWEVPEFRFVIIFHLPCHQAKARGCFQSQHTGLLEPQVPEEPQTGPSVFSAGCLHPSGTGTGTGRKTFLYSGFTLLGGAA